MLNDLPENLKALLQQPDTIPKPEKVFRAFSYFKPEETKVIILGQDPFPSPSNASGLAFSTDNETIPTALKTIYKELSEDIGCAIPKTGALTPWAKQGVLLLNTILTTRRGHSLAHKNHGWQAWTKRKVQKILDTKKPIVLILWGKEAQAFAKDLVLHDKVKILTGAHPSHTVKTGFIGGRYFSRANEFLKANGIKPVDWKL